MKNGFSNIIKKVAGYERKGGLIGGTVCMAQALREKELGLFGVGLSTVAGIVGGMLMEGVINDAIKLIKE